MSVSPKYDFSGKVAFVTGAGSGIGRATAIAFANAGASVAAVDVNEAALNETVAQIAAAGGKAAAIIADVTKGDQVEAAVAQTVSTFGRLDAAHNNAGVEQPGMPLHEVSEELYDRILGINTRGVFLCMKYQIPAMMKNGGGAIVNTGSTAGILSFQDQAAYTASKYGVVALTKCAAMEYASAGIRINSLCPGITDTPMIPRAWGGDKETTARLVAQQPLGRFATPEEMAGGVLWLCSEGAGFVTGTVLSIDGGQSAGIFSK